MSRYSESIEIQVHNANLGTGAFARTIALPAADFEGEDNCLEAAAAAVQAVLGDGPADPTASARWSDQEREAIIVSW